MIGNTDDLGNYCAMFIIRILEVVGCGSWEKLPGCSIRIKKTHSRISSIGNFLKDEWFDPKEEEFIALEEACQKN